MDSLNATIADILVVGGAAGFLVAMELHANSLALESLDSIFAIEEAGDFLEGFSP